MSSEDTQINSSELIAAQFIAEQVARIEALEQDNQSLRRHFMLLKERNSFLHTQVKRLESEITHVRSIQRRRGIV